MRTMLHIPVCSLARSVLDSSTLLSCKLTRAACSLAGFTLAARTASSSITPAHLPSLIIPRTSILNMSRSSTLPKVHPREIVVSLIYCREITLYLLIGIAPII